MDYSSIFDIYCAFACLTFILAGVFCGAVRWCHMCRPYDEQGSYFYPATRATSTIAPARYVMEVWSEDGMTAENVFDNDGTPTNRAVFTNASITVTLDKTKAYIENCHVSGTIVGTGGSSVGGLIGESAFATIKDCSSNVTITGNAFRVGGFGGFVYASTISGCSSEGSVEGQYAIGGFVGDVEWTETQGNMKVENCTASVSINTSNWNVGGFAGWSNAIITNCSASGNITSTPLWNNHIYKTGGFVGTNAGEITSCSYSGTMSYADDAQYYGGFVGNDKSGKTVGCRFDGTKNAQLDASGMSSNNESAGTNEISNVLN